MNAADRIAWQKRVTEETRPVGLGLCWEPTPGSEARNCTLGNGHTEDHFHEYSGVRWDRTGGQL
ncbi:hypothetical protein ACFVYD_00430 [Streptomyces sp. NPDC058301]|uniref:hypothetical protein n=1 Tax=Streptomyces sp. NPDC058301 TaxID=3346436 RepID=UPI0036E5D87B